MNGIKSEINLVIEEFKNLKIFHKVSKQNWNFKKGVELVLYPFFNIAILNNFSNVRGVGYGKFADNNYIIDCIVYLDSKVIGIEIKGPSKDISFVKNGVKKDSDRLKELKKLKKIDIGVSIGFLIKEDPENNKDYLDIEIQYS